MHNVHTHVNTIMIIKVFNYKSIDCVDNIAITSLLSARYDISVSDISNKIQQLECKRNSPGLPEYLLLYEYGDIRMDLIRRQESRLIARVEFSCCVNLSKEFNLSRQPACIMRKSSLLTIDTFHGIAFYHRFVYLAFCELHDLQLGKTAMQLIVAQSAKMLHNMMQNVEFI